MASPVTATGDLRKHLISIHPLSDLSLPSLPPTFDVAHNMRDALQAATVGQCLHVGRATAEARQRVRTALMRFKPLGTVFARFDLERRDGGTDLWLIRIR